MSPIHKSSGSLDSFDDILDDDAFWTEIDNSLLNSGCFGTKPLTDVSSISSASSANKPTETALKNLSCNIQKQYTKTEKVVRIVEPEKKVSLSINANKHDLVTAPAARLESHVNNDPENQPKNKTTATHTTSTIASKEVQPLNSIIKEDTTQSTFASTPKSTTSKAKKQAWQSKLTSLFLAPKPDPDQKRTYSTSASSKDSKNSKPQFPPPPASQFFLSEEQKRVLNFIVHEKRNIFFTGAAGTGKSVLLRNIIKKLRQSHRVPGAVAVTASTGLAACNVGGSTLHSFCGIGLGKDPVDRLLKKIRTNPNALKRWKAVQVLIIDEVSMIDAALFDKLEEIARTIKRKDIPFGGIQVVLTGDFFQLPPVFDQNLKNDPAYIANDMDGKLAFQSKSWSKVINITVELKQVFRQTDNHFAKMLDSIRNGITTPEMVEELQALSRSPENVPKNISPTELFPLRKDVDRANKKMIEMLKGPVHTFKAIDTYNNPGAKAAQILNNLMCPSILHLKKGAQVMLVKNIDETLVNGSLGEVLGFMSESTFKIVEDMPQSYKDSISVGEKTIEEVVDKFVNKMDKKVQEKLAEMERNNVPSSDESYIPSSENTDASRIEDSTPNQQQQQQQQSTSDDIITSSNNQDQTTPSKPPLLLDDPFDIPEEFLTDDDFSFEDQLAKEDKDYVINWARKYQLIESLNESTEQRGAKWPYVRFTIPDGTTRDILVQSESWDIEDYDGKVQASRSQVPLILAWALSIHKSQGQTLQWLKVDLSKTFERGQAYVALSRAVSMDGLQVLGFNPSVVRVHPAVLEFYKSLPSPLEIPYLDEAALAQKLARQAKRKTAKKNRIQTLNDEITNKMVTTPNTTSSGSSSNSNSDKNDDNSVNEEETLTTNKKRESRIRNKRRKFWQEQQQQQELQQQQQQDSNNNNNLVTPTVVEKLSTNKTSVYYEN